MNPLTQVAYLGLGFFHQFVDTNGVVSEVETTQADYDQLATAQHKDPTSPGLTWIGSVSRPKFNTPTSQLSDDQYGVVGAVNIVKLPGQSEFVTTDSVSTLDSLALVASTSGSIQLV